MLVYRIDKGFCTISDQLRSTQDISCKDHWSLSGTSDSCNNEVGLLFVLNCTVYNYLESFKIECSIDIKYTCAADTCLDSLLVFGTHNFL